jgi:tripartite-type tricarboxylate transporter receptor subunit TctC
MARSGTWSILTLCLAGLLGLPARAAEPADFWRGKTLTLLVGYTAGGGYDIYARTLARFMSRHMPGNPVIVTQNMPGAGSLTMANYLFNVAPRDGTYFGTFARGMAMEPLVGGGKAMFDSRQFGWLGSATDEISVCATTSHSAVRSYDDMLQHEFTVGGEGGGSDPDTFAAVTRNLLGAKIRIVTGYPGGNEITLAIDRGEVDGRCGWSWTTIKATRPDWVREHRLNVLLLMGLHRSPELPDVPTILEKAHDERQLALMKLVFTRQTLGRPFAAPPEVPADRLAVLRHAFDATMADPDFLAEARQLSLEISPVTGVEVERIVRDLYETPKEVLNDARAIIKAAGK